ncbi:MAG TPA: asparagine synthase (glutamine-hydrolyzing) [Puia sp.]
MCGFAGLINNSFPVSRNQVSEIAAKVAFRGPDSHMVNLYDERLQSQDQGINAVFFNRLAIMDLDVRSDQPFEDDRYTLLFNGEIYNYQELKGLLQKEGYVFRTTSDTEVLFFALKKWGRGALRRLNGMFSIFWMDRQNKSFLLARDRMGIKPLCYRQLGSSLIFGSDVNSVIRLSDELPVIENRAIDHFLWTQYIPTPFTIFKGVFKLPPGHFIESSWEKLENRILLVSHAYWDAFTEVLERRAEPAPLSLENLLVDSLSRQLIADVPLGLFLSSGVDSSLLAALVSKHFSGDQDFNFFTVAFTESTSSDESGEARQFIRGLKNPRLKSHILEINPELIGVRLIEMYEYFDEPFGDPASLLNWVISSKAKEHVTVALSGDGADELFWGYERYNRWQNPSLNLKKRIRIPGTQARLIEPFLPGRYLKAKAALELERNPLHRHFTLFLSPALKHLVKQPPWELDIWAMQNINGIKDRDDLTALMDIKTYLADAMLYKVDRASMAASLEVRVPYLDNVVVDYALSSSLHDKSHGQFRNKAMLKKLLMRLAPHYDIQRPKKGFNFPLDKWLRLQWKDMVLSLITKENLLMLGLDDHIYLPMVTRYYAGEKRFCVTVWYLLNLVLWNRKFMKISVLKPT